MNEITDVPGEVRSIELKGGSIALVDAADYDCVAHMQWRLISGRYAYSSRRGVDGAQLIVYMHRLLLGAPPRLRVDHINGIELDNRRSNLRLCTQSQNMANAPSRVGSSSPYKGVYWSGSAGRWIAHVGFHGKKHYLGCFVDPVEAAAAYDAAALHFFGEFARLNFPVTTGAQSAILTA